MSQGMVKHKFKEQKEPEGSASRQAEKPGGSSQQLMEREPDSKVRSYPARSLPGQVPGPGVGSRAHRCRQVSDYTCLERRQAGRLPKAYPSQAGSWPPGSLGQREKSGPGKPHLLSHDKAPCCLEPAAPRFRALLLPPEHMPLLQSPTGFPAPPPCLLQALPWLPSPIKTALSALHLLSNHPLYSMVIFKQSSSCLSFSFA